MSEMKRVDRESLKMAVMQLNGCLLP